MKHDMIIPTAVEEVCWEMFIVVFSCGLVRPSVNFPCIKLRSVFEIPVVTIKATSRRLFAYTSDDY